MLPRCRLPHSRLSRLTQNLQASHHSRNFHSTRRHQSSLFDASQALFHWVHDTSGTSWVYSIILTGAATRLLFYPVTFWHAYNLKKTRKDAALGQAWSRYAISEFERRAKHKDPGVSDRASISKYMDETDKITTGIFGSVFSNNEIVFQNKWKANKVLVAFFPLWLINTATIWKMGGLGSHYPPIISGFRNLGLDSVSPDLTIAAESFADIPSIANYTGGIPLLTALAISQWCATSDRSDYHSMRAHSSQLRQKPREQRSVAENAKGMQYDLVSVGPIVYAAAWWLAADVNSVPCAVLLYLISSAATQALLKHLTMQALAVPLEVDYNAAKNAKLKPEYAYAVDLDTPGPSLINSSGATPNAVPQTLSMPQKSVAPSSQKANLGRPTQANRPATRLKKE